MDIPEASTVTPSLLIGFADLLLPFFAATSLQSQLAKFIVCVIGTIQVICMSESLPHLASAFEDDKTDFILDTLRQYDVKATFFLCGFWAEKYPDKVRAIIADGHVIGNHSATHPHMAGMQGGAIEKELAAFEKIVEPLIGKRTTLFRAPYGEYNDNVVLTARNAGYEVVQWDVDTVDTVWMTWP